MRLGGDGKCKLAKLGSLDGTDGRDRDFSSRNESPTLDKDRDFWELLSRKDSPTLDKDSESCEHLSSKDSPTLDKESDFSEGLSRKDSPTLDRDIDLSESPKLSVCGKGFVGVELFMGCFW